MNILAAPEDDTSEEFLKKIADNNARTLLIDYTNSKVAFALSHNEFALKIEGKYYLFPCSASYTQFDPASKYGNLSIFGYSTDTTETFRLY